MYTEFTFYKSNFDFRQNVKNASASRNENLKMRLSKTVNLNSSN